MTDITLYRLNQVADPDGSLQDALADLLDEGALVEAALDDAMISRAAAVLGPCLPGSYRALWVRNLAEDILRAALESPES